jgi:hypothetical protein
MSQLFSDPEILIGVIIGFVFALRIIVPAITAWFGCKAFRVSRKKGYLWITVFALMPLVSLGLERISLIMRIRDDITQSATISTVELIPALAHTTRLPIIESIPAIGVFLLARAERQNKDKKLSHQ